MSQNSEVNKLTLAESLQVARLKDVITHGKSRNGKGLSKERKEALQMQLDEIINKASGQ